MSGTIKVGDTNITITDNHSSDIALASFSGYIATTAELSEKYGGQPGKKVAIVLKTTDGIVTGTYLAGYALAIRVR